MYVVYRLIGHGKKTERLAVRIDVPGRLIFEAEQIADIKEDDETRVGDSELSPEPATGLALLIRARIEVSLMTSSLNRVSYRGEAMQR